MPQRNVQPQHLSSQQIQPKQCQYQYPHKDLYRRPQPSTKPYKRLTLHDIAKEKHAKPHSSHAPKSTDSGWFSWMWSFGSKETPSTSQRRQVPHAQQHQNIVLPLNSQVSQHVSSYSSQNDFEIQTSKYHNDSHHVKQNREWNGYNDENDQTNPFSESYIPPLSPPAQQFMQFPPTSSEMVNSSPRTCPACEAFHIQHLERERHLSQFPHIPLKPSQYTINSFAHIPHELCDKHYDELILIDDAIPQLPHSPTNVPFDQVKTSFEQDLYSNSYINQWGQNEKLQCSFKETELDNLEDQKLDQVTELLEMMKIHAKTMNHQLSRQREQVSFLSETTQESLDHVTRQSDRVKQFQ